MNRHVCVSKLIYVIQYVSKYVISSHINTKDSNLYMQTLKYFRYYLRKDMLSFPVNHIILSIQKDDYPPPDFLAFVFFFHCSYVPIVRVGVITLWERRVESEMKHSHFIYMGKNALFQIWVTAWHAKGDTNDPGGHSSSSWKLRSNSCDFLLLLERWMQPCVSQMKKFPVKWTVCCPRLLGDVSSWGTPSESLLKECPVALLCLYSANIPDTSLSFLGHGFSFPRMKLQTCVPSRL